MAYCDRCRVARALATLITPSGDLHFCLHCMRTHTDGLTMQDGWYKSYNTTAIKELR